MKSDREIDVLARTIYGEARGSSEHGKLAVAHVILNRVRARRWWGTNIIEVCLFAKQFSCWNEADINRVKLMSADLSDEAFRKCYIAALNAYNGEKPDPTGNSTHYHHQSVNPSWASQLVKTVHIGVHVFYRQPD